MVPSLEAVTPVPAEGCAPGATSSGGQLTAHCPVQVDLPPGASDLKVYNVMPRESTRTFPSCALLATDTCPLDTIPTALVAAAATVGATDVSIDPTVGATAVA